MTNILRMPWFGRPINQPTWIDNQTLAVSVARGFQTAIEIVGTQNPGRVQPIAGLSGNVSTFARAPDGTIAYVSETAVHAPELWLKNPNAPAAAVTTLNERWTSRPVIAPEFVTVGAAGGSLDADARAWRRRRQRLLRDECVPDTRVGRAVPQYPLRGEVVVALGVGAGGEPVLSATAPGSVLVPCVAAAVALAGASAGRRLRNAVHLTAGPNGRRPRHRPGQGAHCGHELLRRVAAP